MKKEKNRRYIIYALVDPRTQEWRYIGQSVCGLKRPRSHVKLLKIDKNNHKTNWIRQLLALGLKYDIEILEEFNSFIFLNKAEIEWIAEARRQGCPLVNLTGGGGGSIGFKHSEEFSKNLSKRMKGGISPHKGDKCTEETKLQMKDSALRRSPDSIKTRMAKSNGLKGKPRHDSVKVKVSKGKNIEAFVDENGNIYNTLSEAARALNLWIASVSSVLKGDWKSTEGHTFKYLNPPKMVFKENRKIIDNKGTVYNSITQAGKVLNIHYSNISAVLHGRRTHAKGLTFSYVDSQ